MGRHIRLITVLAALVLTASLAVEQDAHARAGGGRSSGSRGSRSYSRPMAPPSQSPSRSYAPSQPYQQPYQQPYRQPGGFFRNFGGSMLGGIAGGLLGGMLFRSLGFGGGGIGGGGIGLFDILLLVGIGYLIYRFVSRKKGGNGNNYDQRDNVIPMGGYQSPSTAPTYEPERDEVAEGIAYIRQMDPSFDERRFGDQVMDMFFKIQGGWMNRDLSGVSHLLTDEMRNIMQRDVDMMRSEKKVNRLENIAVRSVEISEAWQEGGQDFVTALIYANLLDYTTDDVTGAVVAGSKTDPVKFEEYWTFTRPVGNNPWKLSAITQK